MSQQSVIQFFDVILQNKELPRQLNYEVAESVLKILLRIMEENDHNFSNVDLEAVLEKQTELTDECLEAVA